MKVATSVRRPSEQTEFSYLELNAQYESAAHNITAAELNLIVMEHNLQAAQAASIRHATQLPLHHHYLAH